MGIGEATAEYFAAAGASVVLAARSASAIEAIAARIAQSGGTAICIPTDVTDEDSVRRLVEQTVDRFGRLDCAVNNAGMNPNTFTTIDEYPMDEFRSICDVKVYGVACCLKHEIAAMKAAGTHGSIVNQSSVVGVQGSSGTYPAASASQAAVIGITKAAAAGAAPFGIRVNALAIGAVATGTIGALSPEEQAQYAAHVPLGRLGTGDDIAAAAAYLCSDMASWVTGALLPVEGGHLA